MGEQFFNVVKRYGMSTGLMLVGLYYLNGKLASAEKRIEAVEQKLYECYEIRLLPSSAISKVDFSSVKMLCTIPKEQEGIKESEPSC